MELEISEQIRFLTIYSNANPTKVSGNAFSIFYLCQSMVFLQSNILVMFILYDIYDIFVKYSKEQTYLQVILLGASRHVPPLLQLTTVHNS